MNTHTVSNPENSGINPTVQAALLAAFDEGLDRQVVTIKEGIALILSRADESVLLHSVEVGQGEEGHKISLTPAAAEEGALEGERANIATAARDFLDVQFSQPNYSDLEEGPGASEIIETIFNCIRSVIFDLGNNAQEQFHVRKTGVKVVFFKGEGRDFHDPNYLMYEIIVTLPKRGTIKFSFALKNPGGRGIVERGVRITYTKIGKNDERIPKNSKKFLGLIAKQLTYLRTEREYDKDNEASIADTRGKLTAAVEAYLDAEDEDSF